MPLAGYEQVPRYRELVERLLGEDVEFLPPGIILEIDRPEWLIHRREYQWTTGRVTIAASPANNGRIQVLNPVGSNRISVVVNWLIFSKLTAGGVRVGVSAAAAGTPAPCLALDTRLPFSAGPGAPVVVTQSLIANNNAVFSGYIIEQRTTTVANQDVSSLLLPQQPVILAPGQNLTIFNETVNEAFAGYIWGYERVARSEELVG